MISRGHALVRHGRRVIRRGLQHLVVAPDRLPAPAGVLEGDPLLDDARQAVHLADPVPAGHGAAPAADLKKRSAGAPGNRACSRAAAGRGAAPGRRENDPADPGPRPRCGGRRPRAAPGRPRADPGPREGIRPPPSRTGGAAAARGPPDPARGRGRGGAAIGAGSGPAKVAASRPRPGGPREPCRREGARARAGRGAARDGGAGRAADGAGGGRCPRRTKSGAGGRAAQPAPPRAPPPEFPDGVAGRTGCRFGVVREGAVPACGAARSLPAVHGGDHVRRRAPYPRVGRPRSLRQPAGARFGLGAGGEPRDRPGGAPRGARDTPAAPRRPSPRAGSPAKSPPFRPDRARGLPGTPPHPFRVRRICASAGAARAGGGGGPAAGGGEARPGGPRPLPRQGPRLLPPGRVGGGIGGPASGRRPDADRLYVAPVYYAALRALRHGFARARRNGSAAPRALVARRCRCRRGRRRGGRPGRGPAPARCGRAGGCRRVRRGAGACGSGMRGGPACRGSFGGGGADILTALQAVRSSCCRSP